MQADFKSARLFSSHLELPGVESARSQTLLPDASAANIIHFELSAPPDGFEIDAEYDVEADQGYERIETGKGTEYRFFDVKAPYIAPLSGSAPVFLPPGRSLIFAVKREHLAKHLNIYPTYKYEWETSEKDSGFEEPRHRAYFSDYKLEKALERRRIIRPATVCAVACQLCAESTYKAPQTLSEYTAPTLRSARPARQSAKMRPITRAALATKR